MKNSIFILSIIYLLITSCSTLSTNKVKVVGVLENVLSDKVYLESTSDSTINLTASIQDSKFELEFEVEKPMWFRLRFNKDKCNSFIVSTELFLEPGDNIQITGNAAAFYSTIKAEGKGAEENNFLFSKFKIHYPECSGWPPSKSLEPAEYLSQLNKMKKELADDLKRYDKGRSMNRDFVDFETRKDTYRWAYTKCTYPSFYKENQGTYPNNLPDDYYTFLEEVNYSDEEMYFSAIGGKYLYLVNWYFNGQGGSVETDIEAVKEQISLIEEKVKSQKIKEDLIYDLLVDHIEDHNSSNLEELMEEYNINDH